MQGHHETITMHYASAIIYTRTTPSCVNHHAPPTWIEYYALFLHPSSPYHAIATPHPLDHVVTPSMFHVHLAIKQPSNLQTAPTIPFWCPPCTLVTPLSWVAFKTPCATATVNPS